MSPRIIRQKLNYSALPVPRAFEWAVYRANPLTIQLGVFRGADVADLSGLDSIRIDARASLSSGDDIFTHTVAAEDFGALTSGTWLDGTAQHATFSLTSGNTNRAPVAEGFVALHIVITAVAGDEEITLGVGRLLILEDNNGTDYPPEENAAARKYVFGEISESGASLKLYDRDMNYKGWCQIMSGDAP